jgi:hypothetical protein
VNASGGPSRGAGDGAARSLSRGRFAVRTVIVLVAVAVSCVLATVLASRVPMSLDLTATREHRLSPQTQRVLDGLAGPVDLLIASDLSTLDRSSREQLSDVLDKFARVDGRVRVTTLDTGSAHGLAQYDEALARLAERSASEVKAAAEPVERAIGVARATAQRLAADAERLSAIREQLLADEGGLGASAVQFKQYFQQQAAAARIAGSDLAAAADRSVGLLREPASRLAVPAVDEAATALAGPMGKLASDLTVLQTGLERFSRLTGVPAEAGKRAGELAGELPALRDALAREAGALRAVRAPGILRVARALQTQRGAVLLADPATVLPAGRDRVAALDLEALFPPSGGERGGAGLDTRARREEVIAAGLSRFTGLPRPVVVLVHGEAQRFAPGFGSRTQTMQRLALLGFDAVEWAAALDPEPPAIEAGRPVVFVSASVEPGSAEAAGRMGKLAAALAKLVESGRAVLLSVNVSALPGLGSPDPIVEFLEPLGVKADSGRALLDEVRGVRRVVLTDQDLSEAGTEHAIGGPLRGVRTVLPWCVPLRLAGTAPAGVRVEPVLSVPADGGRWASAEWLALRQTPPAQRAMMSNPPARGAPGDDAGSGQPWVIAAAIERERAAGRQRVLVVGSEGWFSDGFTAARLNSDGREVLAVPGNFELLAAGLWWLSDQEDRIARSAGAEASAAIPNLSPGQRAVIRWVLAAGMPIMVLLAGVMWRVWRG